MNPRAFAQVLSTDVLVIGGGATGAGTALDLALRGLRVILVERGGLCEGASGRHGGILNSGCRYAVRDPESACECISENRILRRIAPHAIPDVGGMYVLLEDDDPGYPDIWLPACRQCGIPVDEFPASEALRREPALNPRISRAFLFPDTGLDSFELVSALKTAIEANGGKVLTHHDVIALCVEGARVKSAVVRSTLTGEEVRIDAQMVVNAAGAWAGRLAALAGCQINVRPNKGTNITTACRIVNTIVERLRVPSDGDAFIPAGGITIFGSTSVPVETPDDMRVQPWEVQKLLKLAEEVVPGYGQIRSLRAWAGVRPLYSESSGAESRQVPRTFFVIDHSANHGIEGIISIVGGKLTTYRLMAEKAADQVCHSLGIDKPCQTEDFELPRPRPASAKQYPALGDRLEQVEAAESPSSIVCECELVQRHQIDSAAQARSDANAPWFLDELRRELRLGMGPCQGAFCGYRAAAILHEDGKMDAEGAMGALSDFAQERWKGQRPVLWGANLRQALLNEWIYRSILGLDQFEAGSG